MQRRVRRAYYATITNVDTQFSRLLRGLDELGVATNTVVVFSADHAQNLGKRLWHACTGGASLGVGPTPDVVCFPFAPLWPPSQGSTTCGP